MPEERLPQRRMDLAGVSGLVLDDMLREVLLLPLELDAAKEARGARLII